MSVHSIEEAEQKLNQALQLVMEAVAMLEESRKGPMPQVLNRINAAQASRPGPTLALLRKQSPKRKERAHFYLRIAETSDPTNDDIFRVVGDGGLAEAHEMETKLAGNPGYQVTRLDSREFSALIERRLRQIRKGHKGYVGTTAAKDMRGNNQEGKQS